MSIELICSDNLLNKKKKICANFSNHGSVRKAETNFPSFFDSTLFFQKIVVARDKTVYLHHVDGTFFLITVTLARFRIIKKIKKAETRLCRREREREREKTHDREIGVIAIVCVCVRVIWNVAADFAGTAPRIFLSLGKRV